MVPTRTNPSDLNPVSREVAAGVIVYRRTKEGVRFLLLYRSYWNFPKGKIEKNESSLEAALRETEEETGIEKKDLRFIRNFKGYERFNFKRGEAKIHKTVIFYLAETKKEEIKLSEEHNGYAWFLRSEAVRALGKYKDSQRLFKQAYEMLSGGPKSKPQGVAINQAGRPDSGRERHRTNRFQRTQRFSRPRREIGADSPAQAK